jgi:hypothetical protein
MKFRLRKPSLDGILITAITIAVVVLGGFIYWLVGGRTVTVNNPQSGIPLSPLTGQPCAGATQRPIAVMISSDPEARPLSGIGEADMVIEMPVTPDGITRMMAVFQCQTPKEIGSIRSARGSFIPLAQGLDVIYAHWGGERDVEAALNSHVIDNVNGLIYDGTTFYRKKGVPAPHDGFSTLSLIRAKAAQLGYTASVSLTPYPHTTTTPEPNLGDLSPVVSISWPQGMDVTFHYDTSTHTYLRWRGGTPEIDATTGQQVHTSVVIVMQTDAMFLYDQYISVRVLGQGPATIYQNGRSISAIWQKNTATGMLSFVDASGNPVALAPGPLWIDITAPLPQP